MRIIGAGWGRTGTTSASAGLERLGAGPCLHMHTVFRRPDLAELFARSPDERARVDWAAALAEFGSGVDWPACWYWRELAAAHPEAPVLLSVRDPESWHASVLATIHPKTGPEVDLGEVRGVMDRLWHDDFGGWEAAADPARAIARFEAHNDAVRRDCPPDRLIEWRVQDGWGPLCRALGVPEPDEPFPHLNDRASFG